MANAQRESRSSPIAVYPEELTALVVGARGWANEEPIDSKIVTQSIQKLLQAGESFSTAPLAYRVLPHGPSAPAVDEYFEFLRLEGYAVHYNPTTITARGRDYLKRVWLRFFEEEQPTAVALANALGVPLEKLGVPEH